MQEGYMEITSSSKTTTQDHIGRFLVGEFLDAEDVQQMPRPACSPDMNPIEHAWDALGRAINGRNIIPQTLQQLAQALTEEWDALPQESINNLVDSMTRRVDALIRVRGGHTRY